MSLRTCNALGLALLTLTGCSEPEPDTQVIANVEQAAAATAEDGGRVLCAVDGARAFQRSCAVDRNQGETGLVLTVRHPDGAFHRLLVTKDGRGVVAADGAQPAEVTIVDGDSIEVAIADDRYRLPATVGPVSK
ncbi:MAG: hypothetical protein DI610_04665 [Staphylococcus hominis]|nr:MAG: hypothetical protein DI610_04665 [Staphylococcus hominis]